MTSSRSIGARRKARRRLGRFRRKPPLVTMGETPIPPAQPVHDGQLESGAAELRLLARHAEQLRENERAELARELHDELGQLLTGLRMQLDMAERVRSRGGDLQAEHERLGHLMDATLASTRSILAHLRPRILEDFGLVEALSWLASDARRRSGIAVHFRSEPADVEVPLDVARCVFRIVQECLTNVLRHAQARELRIDLALEGDDLVVRVADDGVGVRAPAAPPSPSMGVLGMRERALALGGTFELSSPPEGGARVEVRLPAHLVTP